MKPFRVTINRLVLSYLQATH